MSSFGSNTGYVDDLYQKFLDDPSSVSPAWREFFEDFRGSGPTPSRAAAPAPRVEPIDPPASGGTATATETKSEVQVQADEQVEVAERSAEYEPIRGVAAAIVDNMETSLGVPTATTVRTIPVRLLEENRRLINEHQNASAQRKVSFTHIIA